MAMNKKCRDAGQRPSIKDQVRAYIKAGEGNADRPELYPDAGSDEFIAEWLRQSSRGARDAKARDYKVPCPICNGHGTVKVGSKLKTCEWCHGESVVEEAKAAKARDASTAVKCWECGERFEPGTTKYPMHNRADGYKCKESGKKVAFHDEPLAISGKATDSVRRDRMHRALDKAIDIALDRRAVKSLKSLAGRK